MSALTSPIVEALGEIPQAFLEKWRGEGIPGGDSNVKKGREVSEAQQIRHVQNVHMWVD